MAGEVRIGGGSASVNLQGNDAITEDQTFTFPNTGGELAINTGGGDAGVWERDGTTLKPANSGDGITAAGDSFKLYPNGSLDFYRETTTATNTLLTLHSDRGGTREPKVTFTADGGFSAGGDQFEFYGNGSIDQYRATSDDIGLYTMFSDVGGTREQKIIFKASGSAKYMGKIDIGDSSDPITDPNALAAQSSNDSLGNNATIYARQWSNAGRNYIGISKAGVATFEVFGNGDIEGNITRLANVELKLDFENPDSWKVTQEEYQEDVTGPLGKVEKTVTKTREVREYIGKTLDVRETLQSLLTRAEAQDAVIADLTRQITELKGAN